MSSTFSWTPSASEPRGSGIGHCKVYTTSWYYMRFSRNCEREGTEVFYKYSCQGPVLDPEPQPTPEPSASATIEPEHSPQDTPVPTTSPTPNPIVDCGMRAALRSNWPTPAYDYSSVTFEHCKYETNQAMSWVFTWDPLASEPAHGHCNIYTSSWVDLDFERIGEREGTQTWYRTLCDAPVHEPETQPTPQPSPSPTPSPDPILSTCGVQGTTMEEHVFHVEVDNLEACSVQCKKDLNCNTFRWRETFVGGTCSFYPQSFETMVTRETSDFYFYAKDCPFEGQQPTPSPTPEPVHSTESTPSPTPEQSPTPTPEPTPITTPTLERCGQRGRTTKTSIFGYAVNQSLDACQALCAYNIGGCVTFSWRDDGTRFFCEFFDEVVENLELTSLGETGEGTTTFYAKDCNTG